MARRKKKHKNLCKTPHRKLQVEQQELKKKYQGDLSCSEMVSRSGFSCGIRRVAYVNNNIVLSLIWWVLFGEQEKCGYDDWDKFFIEGECRNTTNGILE